MIGEWLKENTITGNGQPQGLDEVTVEGVVGQRRGLPGDDGAVPVRDQVDRQAHQEVITKGKTSTLIALTMTWPPRRTIAIRPADQHQGEDGTGAQSCPAGCTIRLSTACW